jgi:hypothetical protein
MQSSIFLATLTLGGLLLASAPARAAVTLVTERGNSGTTTIVLDGDHLRIEHPAPGERTTATIIDAQAKKVVMVNDREKSYSELTEADRQAMRERMDAVRAQMKDRMKNLPPDQRKKMEEMMAERGIGEAGAAKEPPSKFEATGAKKTVNGIACDMYRRMQEGKVREELCISPWSAGLVRKSDFAGVQKFAAGMMEDFGGPRAKRRNPLADLDQYPGLPISRVSIGEDGKRGEEEQIKSIKRGSVPASTFAAPAGYSKKEIPLGRGPAPHGGPH